MRPLLPVASVVEKIPGGVEDGGLQEFGEYYKKAKPDVRVKN